MMKLLTGPIIIVLFLITSFSLIIYSSTRYGTDYRVGQCVVSKIDGRKGIVTRAIGLTSDNVIVRFSGISMKSHLLGGDVDKYTYSEMVVHAFEIEPCENNNK